MKKIVALIFMMMISFSAYSAEKVEKSKTPHVDILEALMVKYEKSLADCSRSDHNEFIQCLMTVMESIANVWNANVSEAAAENPQAVTNLTNRHNVLNERADKMLRSHFGKDNHQ